MAVQNTINNYPTQTGLISSFVDSRLLELWENHLSRVFFWLLMVAIGGALSVVVGYLIGSMGTMGVMFVPLSAFGIALVMMLKMGRRLFWMFLLFLLVGYLFGGKGFSYVGFFPIFVGEIGLVMGVGCLLLLPFTKAVRVSFKFVSLPVIVLLIFMVVQVFATIPYFSAYKIDTLRDAMMYLYAVYALLIGLMIPRAWVAKFFIQWRQMVRIFIIAVPFIYIIISTVGFPIKFPGAPVPLLSPKFGDIGVHLAGAGAFLLLRLDNRDGKGFSQTTIWMLWAAWGMGWLLFGSSNRAGMLAALSGIGLALLLWPRSGWYRPLLLVTFVTLILLATGLYSDLKVPTGKGREISAEQIVNNFVSIFAEADTNEGGLEGTKEWRINWWTDIINYTVHGEYFWTGKGYGVNLAISDGYTVGGHARLRSPHNSHFNYLARSGVPGFVLWITFLATFYGRLLYIIITRRTKRSWEAKYAVWLFAYTAAFLVNASFDLVLESPFAAIWFWSLAGMAFTYFSQKPRAVNREIRIESQRREVMTV